ncbi:MAG: hypothetical protein PHP17_01180 [Candidatus Omnitrophica bacterium]|nr:hypothetical protein [Candidatus Omnitrophota bacterium]
MKRMTPATRLFLNILKGKYKYFAERKMLAIDGSFYCIDKHLIEQLGISDNTIRRARIFLKEAGEINYVIGRHKGVPTRYWIIPKGAKKEPIQPVKEAKMEPSAQNAKGANLSTKQANLVAEGSQIDTLDNKGVIKDENKDVSSISSLSEEIKEGIKAYARSFGILKASNLLIDKGYDKNLIEKILEEATVNA